MTDHPTEPGAIWTEETVAGVDLPIVAFAVHDGHDVRGDVRDLLALNDEERRREEDPFTGPWTEIAPVRCVGRVSRFQVDLNRPRASAVYRVPADAWGLQVWKQPLPEKIVQDSLREYDEFYAAARRLIGGAVETFGQVVVYDLHTYNHRREGPEGPAASPQENPQVNIGTGTMDRDRWAPVVDRFLADLRAYDFPGGPLDVRENVKFRGGNVSRWTHETFPEGACAIAIEFKKFFMDEWTGVPDPDLLRAIRAALQSTVPGVIEALRATR